MAQNTQQAQQAMMAGGYNHVEIKSFKGLYLNQNSFTIPDGALEQALNTVIVKDGVLEKRRGYFTFNTPPGLSTLNNLGLYQNTLIAILNNAIEWIDINGVATALTGFGVNVTTPRVSRNAQSNGNFYFTTDNGVAKLEAYNSSVYEAGIPPALDMRGKFAAADGPIAGNTQVAYRAVFGRTDANNNLLLGSPSDILVLINRLIVGSSYALVTNVVTITTSVPHNLSVNMVVNTSNDSNTAITDGPKIVTSTPSPTTFTFAFTHANISGTIDFAADRDADLEFTKPSEVNSTEYFWQLYRSSQSVSDQAVPPEDFKLVTQQQITAQELSSGIIFYQDSTLDLFLGAELYTNPNSQEGDLQANARPPLCQDITIYKNHQFYANTTSRYSFNLNLVSTSSSFINSGDYVEVQLSPTTRRYVARTGVGNSTVSSESVTGSGTITVTITAHGFINGDMVYVSNVQGGAFAVGTYTVGGVTANTFTLTGSGTATSLNIEGVTNGANPIFQLVPPGVSVAAGIDSTARGLVRAIDRDSLSPIYANYVSGVEDVPGKMVFQAKGFGAAFGIRANTVTVGQAFSPELTTSFTDNQSTNDVIPNAIYSSKLGEPEAVPIVNQFLIGSKNKAILRVFALRDSCIILKEDGVWRLDGDDVTNFAVTLIDGTILCLVPSSAVVLNNQVYFLSNQGVVCTSNNAVQIISRPVEDPIAPIFGYPQLLSTTSAAAYESARLYLLTTLLPNTTTPSVVWCYNVITNTWTMWDEYFSQGVVGPSDKLHLISLNNTIKKERKNQNKTDYTGESFAITASTVASDKFSAIISSPSHTPQPGEVIVYLGIVTRINSATALGGANFNVLFDNVTNLINGASAVLYEFFDTQIKLAPYHAGMIDRAKQFSQIQVHLRDDSISAIDITYSNDTFGGSEVTNWRETNIAVLGGWGQQPWGFFPWGQDAGIQLNYQTKPAPIIRSYVPLYAQRGTYIQPTLDHKIAAEILNIQSIGFTVRGYGEKVSR